MAPSFTYSLLRLYAGPYFAGGGGWKLNHQNHTQLESKSLQAELRGAVATALCSYPRYQLHTIHSVLCFLSLPVSV
jgi:hypothetical protein